MIHILCIIIFFKIENIQLKFIELITDKFIMNDIYNIEIQILYFNFIK